jgi:diacylglycerol kinase family enzyme
VSGRAAVIVNPRARRAGGDWQPAVREELGARWSDVDLLVPPSASAATHLARGARTSGYDIVIAAGGDGTVNAIASGLTGTGIPLGILPLGTANDLARELEIPRDPRAAARAIVDGTPRETDLVTVNGRPFCTVGGIALVSRSAMAVTRLKEGASSVRRVANALGGGIYRLAATACLFSPRSIVGTVRLAYREPDTDTDHTAVFDAHALFVANHRTLGGGLVLPIDNSAHDGIFELCVVPRRTRPSLVVNFARLSAGSPLPTGVLVTIRATRAEIRCDSDDAFVADGELLAEGRTFSVGCVRGAVRIVGGDRD